MMKRFLAACACLMIIMGGRALATEEPSYKTAVQDGTLEVRDYPPLVAAEVTVTGDRSQAVSLGFRMLAGYIFGGNTRGQSIAMTAPVVQAPTSGPTLMRPAASHHDGAATWIVQFFMPRGFALATMPAPKDARVHLKALPAARLAVARFSGLAGESDIKRETSRLEAFIAQRRLSPQGPPALARYDPPWTPWFMRRNEIWIPVSPVA